MCGVLALLFIAIPALEIYILIAVGTHIGALATLGIIVATGVLGAALARHQGFAAAREVQRSLATGQKVGRAMVEAALVLVAAVLLVTPGLCTDAVGLALLLPPIRHMAARAVIARFRDRVAHVMSEGSVGIHVSGPRHGNHAHNPEHEPPDPPPPGVIDV